jgi:hypothetical protein
MNADSALALQRATVIKVAWRVMPLIVVSYLVAYIDRSNVAFAAPERGVTVAERGRCPARLRGIHRTLPADMWSTGIRR